MVRERTMRWKYQGLWDVSFPAWGKKKAVIAYYPTRQQYHIAVTGTNLSLEWMTAKEIGEWLRMHNAVRVHR
jgi:hypothetical protein